MDLPLFQVYYAYPVEGKLYYDESSARILGWDYFRQWLSSLAVTPQGKKLCLELQPVSDLKVIQWRQKQLAALRELDEKNLVPPLDSIEEIETQLGRAERTGRLLAEEIIKIARVMTVCASVRRYLLKSQRDSLVELASGVEDLYALGRDLSQSFDEKGQLRDSASPELAESRRKVRMLSESIRLRLEKIIRRPEVARCLQDTYVTERNSRYVIPVRADAPERIAGIVHDTSQSGATLFIEPAELVDDGNRLKIAYNEALEQEAAILGQYSEEIGQAAGAIRKNLEMLAMVDLLWAMHRAEKIWAGQPLELGTGRFFLRSARHPELVVSGREAVANNIEIPEGKRGLIISGPNAGGKTVALKTIGLAVMLAQSGISPPVESGSSLPVFRQIFAVMGDEQDLGRGLSSFTGQLVRILKIWQEAGLDSLVLLDEIMADTDPEQGAALAIELLRALVDRGATVVATTHFEAVKRLAYVDQKFVNASVGFDLEKLRPDYTLNMGVPGRSLTFDIARTLGVPDDLLQRAGQWLSQEKISTEQMLQQLEQDRLQLHLLQQQCREQLEQLKRQSEEVAQTGEKLRQQQQVIRREGRDQLLGEIQKARRLVAQMIEQLKKRPDPRELSRAGQKLKEMEKELRSPPSAPSQENVFRPGDWVTVEGYRATGQIVSIDRKGAWALVRLGKMESRLPLSLLHPVAGEGAEGNRPGLKKTEETPIRCPAFEELTETLDLRGLRVDEALAALEKHLDTLWALGKQKVRVIHGVGNGVLRRAIREYLERCPYQNEFRPGDIEEGGEGVTVVLLK